MNRADAFALMLATFGLALATIAMIEAKETNNGLPLVHAALPSCFQLHPCTRMNCIRRIA